MAWGFPFVEWFDSVTATPYYAHLIEKGKGVAGVGGATALVEERRV